MIQDAKSLCERSLCHHEVPSAPRRLTVTTLCPTVGQRRFGLRWLPPEHLETAPPQRYVVAVADPASASRPPIKLSTIEPDYSQELGRYVPLEELATYELSEEEASVRVPGLFQQRIITVMVAAANKVGQSSWASTQIDLTPTTE